MFDRMDPCGQRLRRIFRQDLYRLLQHDRAVIVFLIHYVNGDAGKADAIVEHGFVHVAAIHALAAE